MAGIILSMKIENETVSKPIISGQAIPAIFAAIIALTIFIPWKQDFVSSWIFFLPAAFILIYAIQYTARQLWRDNQPVKTYLRHIKECQKIMFVAAAMGGAMLAIAFSVTDDPNGEAVAIGGFLYLAAGACGSILEPTRHKLEGIVLGE